MFDYILFLKIAAWIGLGLAFFMMLNGVYWLYYYTNTKLGLLEVHVKRLDISKADFKIAKSFVVVLFCGAILFCLR